MQLRGHRPSAPGDARIRRRQRERHRAIVEPARPHDRGRHVHVHVRGVDRQVRAVDAIAEHLVAHRHAAPVFADGPAGRIGPRDRQLAAVGPRGVHVVHVLREIVQRIAARRRYAHAQLERRVAELGEHGLDLHPVMLWLGNADAIGDGSRRVESDGASAASASATKNRPFHRGTCGRKPDATRPAARRRERLQHEFVRRQRAKNLHRVVDDGLRDAGHLIATREIGKFGRFDGERRDVRVGECHLVRDAHRARTVRTGRRREHVHFRRRRRRPPHASGSRRTGSTDGRRPAARPG